MSDKANILFEIIKGRRTVYPYSYSDKEINDKLLNQIMEAGTWAPNHGMTEPWRFKVFKEDERQQVADFLAKTYAEIFKGKEFNPKKRDNLSTWPLLSQALIAVVMRSGKNPKIPIIEEERAVAAAIQNMLLMAHSYGIGSYWSTGKVIYSGQMKKFLKIDTEDQVVGLIYFGYAKDEIYRKKRRSINKQML